jgi:hypothetical protein
MEAAAPATQKETYRKVIARAVDFSAGVSRDKPGMIDAV